MERNKQESLVLIKNLRKTYKKTQTNINQEIADFYAKHGKENVIEYEKLTQPLSNEDFNLMIRQWDKFVKKYPHMAKFRDIRMGYYKFNQVQGLKNRIARHVAELAIKEEELLKGSMRGVVRKAFNFLTKHLRKNKNNRRDVIPLNDKRIEQLINRKWLNHQNFKDRIWVNKGALQAYFDNDFIASLASGKSYQSIIKEMAKRFEVEEFKAKRLVHTEMANVQNQIHFEVIKDAGFSGYQISATIDSKTSSICREKNGKTYFIDEYEPFNTAPPFHPHCRSTIFGVDKVGSYQNRDRTLNTIDDPIREIEGSMFEKHVEKTKTILANLEKMGVDVSIRKGSTMAYQPAITTGKAGRIVIDEEASYSALLHEYTHAIDDKNIGWLGFSILFDRDKRWEFEKNAYNAEIKHAKLNNLPKSYIIRLEELKEKERKLIYEE